MINLTRLNGQPLALNCDLIERAEANPDTVLTLTDGTKYLVEESVDDVVELIRAFRASVVALSRLLESHQQHSPRLQLVTNPQPEA